MGLKKYTCNPCKPDHVPQLPLLLTVLTHLLCAHDPLSMFETGVQTYSHAVFIIVSSNELFKVCKAGAGTPGSPPGAAAPKL